MGVRSGLALPLCLFLLGPGAGVQGDTCYSLHSGYLSCSGGCCGTPEDQDCCSQTFLIVGLTVGAFVVGSVMVMVVVCLVCKDCRTKMCHCCDDDGDRRGERGRRGRYDRRRGRNGHAIRVTVHPVQPPDYSTATQERAPSVQPGRNRRILPSSPPPPYLETVSPPRSPFPQNSPRTGIHKTTSAAPPASIFIIGNEGRSDNSQDTTESRAAQSSNDDANDSSVLVVQPSRSEHAPNSSETPHTPRLAPSRAASRPTSGGERSAPSGTPRTRSTGSSPVSGHVIHVRESPRTGGAHGGNVQRSARGPDSSPRAAVLHTVNETAEDGDQLRLI